MSVTNAASAATDDHLMEALKARLRAKLALAGGFALHELADGSFLVARWNWTCTLSDLHAVAEFARRVGAR